MLIFSSLNWSRDPSQVTGEVSEPVRSKIAQHIAFNSSSESQYKVSEKDGLPIQEGNKVRRGWGWGGVGRGGGRGMGGEGKRGMHK